MPKRGLSLWYTQRVCVRLLFFFCSYSPTRRKTILFVHGTNLCRCMQLRIIWNGCIWGTSNYEYSCWKDYAPVTPQKALRSPRRQPQHFLVAMSFQDTWYGMNQNEKSKKRQETWCLCSIHLQLLWERCNTHIHALSIALFRGAKALPCQGS